MQNLFDKISSTVSRREAAIEIGLIFALAASYVAAELAHIPKRWIIGCIALALLAYGISIWRRGQETWRDFGLRTDNFKASLIPVTIWTLFAATGIIIWAIVTHTPLWRPELAVLLPLYPFYGIVQQLVFQGVLQRRLMTWTGRRLAAAAVTTLAFALIHLGPCLEDWCLVGLTCAAGGVWSWMFQRWPNVWALGLSHGVLAALTYPLILAANPLQKL